jgi:hypothetical protein
MEDAGLGHGGGGHRGGELGHGGGGLASGEKEIGKKKEPRAKRTFHACSLSSKARN